MGQVRVEGHGVGKGAPQTAENSALRAWNSILCSGSVILSTRTRILWALAGVLCAWAVYPGGACPSSVRRETIRTPNRRAGDRPALPWHTAFPFARRGPGK